LVALTIPDICAGLALDNNIFVKEPHYVAFVDKYTAENELGIDGLTCYRIRGGVVHRANMAGNPKFDATHVIFTPPESELQIHGFRLENGPASAIALRLEQFCKAMQLAAKRWYEDHENDPMVIENMKNLIRYAPNGVYPFIGGFPVVASGPES
jgi:hypothetical protein